MNNKLIWVILFSSGLLSGGLFVHFVEPIVKENSFVTHTITGHLDSWDGCNSTIDGVVKENGYVLYMKNVVYDGVIGSNQHEVWFSNILYPASMWDAWTNHTIEITYRTNYMSVSEITDVMDISEP